jgi:hypothetical protein
MSVGRRDTVIFIAISSNLSLGTLPRIQQFTTVFANRTKDSL